MKTPVTNKNLFSILIFFISFLFFLKYASAETISLSEYKSRIRKAIDFCESSDDRIPSDIRSDLYKLFPPKLSVQQSDEEIFPIDTNAILSLLGKTIEDNGLKDVKTHLNMLLQYIDTPKGDRVVNLHWKESRQLLEEIYQTKEFKGLRERKKPFWVKYLEILTNFLQKWFIKNIDKLAEITSGVSSILLYIIYGLIIMLGGIIIFWISKSFGWFGWQKKDKKLSSLKNEFRKIPDWDFWRKNALEHASKGEFREAIRCLFVSVLMEGHIKGWWVYEPETTNMEHLDRMKGPAGRTKALRSFMDIYERAWYGLGHPGNEEFQKCNKIMKLIETAS